MGILNFFKKDTFKPFRPGKIINKGWLKVDDIHSIYYEISGNAKGIPLINIHGGPGGSISESKKRLYNPKKYMIVQFDQRGCGQSTPKNCFKNNTTEHLIQDIEKLRKHLNIKKFVITGGSWGGTLALLHAYRFKENILAIIVNSCFFFSKERLSAPYSKNGMAQSIFPEAFDVFSSALTKEEKETCLSSYISKIETASTKEEKELLLKNFIKWELTLLKNDHNPSQLNEYLESDDFSTDMALMELRYFKNNCFMEDFDLLKHLEIISDIPTFIVHGRFDMMCSVGDAYKAHKIIKNSRLLISSDGHFMKSDESVKNMLYAANKVLEILKNV